MDEQRAERRLIRHHSELDVYKRSFAVAMRIFLCAKGFPPDERYSLTDQLRRSSRSVCANLAEAWRRRHYEAAFVSKLIDCEAEAAECQTWIRFAEACSYITPEVATSLSTEYDAILGMLVRIRAQPRRWAQ